MPKILIGVGTVVDVPEDLNQHYLKLTEQLKLHGIDLNEPNTWAVFDSFEEVFRPLCARFSLGEDVVGDIVAAVMDYGERLMGTESVYKYALDRHKVDLAEEPYVHMFSHNREAITKDIRDMLRMGKSLEDCYRHVVKESTRYSVTKDQKPN